MLSNHLIFIWFPTSLDYWEILTWPGLKKMSSTTDNHISQDATKRSFWFYASVSWALLPWVSLPKPGHLRTAELEVLRTNCVCCWNHEREHHILGFCLGGEGATYSHPPGLLLVAVIQTCLLPTVSTAATSRRAHLQACGSHACPFRRE